MGKLILLGILASVVSGCAKDRTAEEYQREKADQNMALYNKAAGAYSGVVYSKDNGEVLGAMQLTLRTERLVSPPKEGDNAIGSPNLVGNLQFLDEAVTTLNAPVSFYDPSTGAYQAEIKISRGSTGGDASGGAGDARLAVETVVISGTIGGDSMVGNVQASASPELGGRFVLSKFGESMQTLLERARPGWRPDPNGRSKVRSYLGQTDFTTVNATRAVHAIILQPRTGTESDFLDLISPVKTVELSFNYSQSLHVVFEKALYDRRQGLITGSTVLTVNNQKLMRMTIECRVGENLRCNHLTASGVTARTSARLNSGPVQDPPENSDGRESITKTFVGSGLFGDSVRKMKLVVTKPAKSSLDSFLDLFFPNADYLMNVSIIFSDLVNANFPSALWNSLSGLMEGTFGGSGFTAQVQCRDFHFTESNKPFQCKYWTNRSATITIDFKPPYQ